MTNEMSVDHPSIDWQLSIKLANDNRELARDLLEMFVADLPRAKEAIALAYNQKQYQELIDQVHKLHGASCYCGVIRLKSLLAKMEFSAREKLYGQFEPLLIELNEEVNSTLSTFKMIEFV